MKVHSINLVNLKDQPQISDETKINKKPSCGGCYTTSVFSKGMSGLAFGMAAPVRTAFEREIAEQPKLLKKMAKRFFTKSNNVNIKLNITPGEMARVKRVFILASGSSKNAGEMAKNFIETAINLPVTVESASEFMCKYEPLREGEDIAICISQSGKTADTLAALKMAQLQRVKTVSLTNQENSIIAKTAHSHVFLDAGEENAVAATKTVTGSIYTLMAIGLRLAELKENSIYNKMHIEKLKKIPQQVSELLHDKAGIKQAAKVIADSENIYYYAKNSNIGAVKEGALKLTETTGKRVIADSSSEALHGTFASIKPENPVLQTVLGTKSGDIYSVALDNICEIIKKRNVKNSIIIKSGSDSNIFEKMKDYNPIYISIPETDETLTPLLTTVRMQQITNEVTKLLGINPDNGGGFLTKFRQNISM